MNGTISSRGGREGRLEAPRREVGMVTECEMGWIKKWKMNKSRRKRK